MKSDTARQIKRVFEADLSDGLRVIARNTTALDAVARNPKPKLTRQRTMSRAKLEFFLSVAISRNKHCDAILENLEEK